MKKITILLLCVTVLSSIPANHSYAKQNIRTETFTQTTFYESDVSLRVSDIIIYRYRTKNGVTQYRRWNKTQGYWVDSSWINM
ncbi:hypothetical protein M2146_001308 [Lachnospiraceae bacterium PF1-22]